MIYYIAGNINALIRLIFSYGSWQRAPEGWRLQSGKRHPALLRDPAVILMHPICFHIASRPVYWYGVMMAAAFMAAIAHWAWLARRAGRPANYGYDLAFWLMLSGIVGARINYILANLGDFRAAPWTIVRVDQGGLIYYGGFVGAALTAVIFARVRGERLWWLADFAITAIPLGHFFGRIGCFLNGCCYGAPGTAPWCFPLDDTLRHPVQLYEAGWNMAVYLLLTWMFLRRRTEGAVFALYLMLYPAGRFMLEFWRGDQRQMLCGLTMAQWFSLALMAIGAGLWLLLTRGQPAGQARPNTGKRSRWTHIK